MSVVAPRPEIGPEIGPDTARSTPLTGAVSLVDAIVAASLDAAIEAEEQEAAGIPGAVEPLMTADCVHIEPE